MSDIDEGESGNGGDALVVEGVVKWFDTKKGYGFLVSDNGGKDVLVYHSALREPGTRFCTQALRLSLRWSSGFRGFRRTELSV